MKRLVQTSGGRRGRCAAVSPAAAQRSDNLGVQRVRVFLGLTGRFSSGAAGRRRPRRYTSPMLGLEVIGDYVQTFQ